MSVRFNPSRFSSRGNYGFWYDYVPVIGPMIVANRVSTEAITAKARAEAGFIPSGPQQGFIPAGSAGASLPEDPPPKRKDEPKPFPWHWVVLGGSVVGAGAIYYFGAYRR